MTDDRLLRAFRELDSPAMPDAEFADRLFEDLATGLGFRQQRRRDVVATTLGLHRLPVGAPALRAAYLAAMLALLLALLAGTLLVVGQLRTLPEPKLALTPAELVSLSQAAYADPPAVRFTMTDPMGTSTISSDGKGTWRSETWDEPPGSYYLYDGTRVGIYDATTRTWQVGPVENGGPPFPMNSEFNWVSMSFPALVATISILDCSDAVALVEEEVAGRMADHVGCPGLGLEYWLDRETHLTLRVLAREGSLYWKGGPGDSTTEATSFEVLETVDGSAFAWTGPADDTPRTGEIAGTSLTVGEPPPAWSGETLDGRPWSASDLRQPAAILIFTTGCESCDAQYQTFNDATAEQPGVSATIVASMPLGHIVGYTGQHPTRLDVVADPDYTLNATWGVNRMTGLVLLDRDGAVRDVLPGNLSRSDLDAVLSALANDEPIPPLSSSAASSTTSASPAPSPSPERITEPCGDDEVTCLVPGSVLPAWSGPSMDGSTFESGGLLGRPVVLYIPGPAGACDGPCPDWVFDDLRSFAALAERYGTAATFVMVPWGERMPGDVERQMAEAGVDFPVVMDWDGSIGRALDVAVGGLLVIDAEGRLADQVQAGMLDAATTKHVTSALDRLLAAP